MRGLTCEAWGPYQDLVIQEWDDPVPKDGEILIDVRAAGINFPDLLSIAGKYQDKTEPPFIPGNEACGTVVAMGKDVTKFTVGDNVVITPRGGAFAEKCKVHEVAATPLPTELSFEQGSGYAVTYGTSYHGLKQCANLQAGETMLVLGAAGGVGIAAVELGKAMGATVIAAASSPEKLRFAELSGADHTINYSEDDLKSSIKALTDGQGVDVVYDPVGGELSQLAFRSLAWHGRHLVVGFAGGDIPKMPANIALLKEASLVGVWWGTWVAKTPSGHQQNMQELAQLIAAGKVSPKVTQTFPLEEYADAFDVISERRALGKVAFTL